MLSRYELGYSKILSKKSSKSNISILFRQFKKLSIKSNKYKLKFACASMPSWELGMVTGHSPAESGGASPSPERRKKSPFPVPVPVPAPIGLSRPWGPRPEIRQFPTLAANGVISSSNALRNTLIVKHLKFHITTNKKTRRHYMECTVLLFQSLHGVHMS